MGIDVRNMEEASADEADAIYGDGCPLMNECRIRGIPVMLETPGVELCGADQERSWNPADMVVAEATRGAGWTLEEQCCSMRRI